MCMCALCTHYPLNQWTLWTGEVSYLQISWLGICGATHWSFLSKSCYIWTRRTTHTNKYIILKIGEGGNKKYFLDTWMACMNIKCWYHSLLYLASLDNLTISNVWNPYCWSRHLVQSGKFITIAALLTSLDKH